MSVITEFTVPAGAFALEHTLETLTDATVEVERLATHSREWVMPFLWVASDEDGLETLETTLRNDPSVDDLTLLDSDSNVHYFNVDWAEPVQELVDQIVDRHGVMQEAEAADGTWYLKLQFVDREALEEFQTFFHEQGYAFELQRMYPGSAPKEREYDLTPEQREALVTALRMGYFEVPREAQIEDLSEALGISTNAVSERLRRATGNLTSNALAVSLPSSVDVAVER
ncbi:helix-turn-helix domain-containing protein [Natronosalvus halobius]|uniref:helix-turn-helix domain-containing protein n=1 Tax=Natronosalvus halobius TaxID=2953746 RepID=UPI00209F4AD8|nr:helix-turn-helix domain-containing protein [Natronosalvus halobius]USZ72477.1 helix-turn-helix domain-containing protein [Natronosalvus halobius]